LDNPDIGSRSVSGASNGIKSCSVSGLSYFTTYTWFVNATDGKVWTREAYSLTTKSSPPPSSSSRPSKSSSNDAPKNNPPEIPTKPSGEIFVEIGVVCSYSGSTFDVDNDQIRYKYDWGDGNYSNWSEFVSSNNSVSMNHSWNSNSTYEVRLMSQDKNGSNSNWSSPLIVTVFQPNLNEKPPIDYIGIHYVMSSNQTVKFNASEILDIDTAVFYYWDFGDGAEGTEKTPVHTYDNSGQYNISLSVIDSNGNVHIKSIIATVNSESNEMGVEEKQNISLFGLIIFIGLIVIIYLIIFYRKNEGFLWIRNYIKLLLPVKKIYFFRSKKTSLNESSIGNMSNQTENSTLIDDVFELDKINYYNENKLELEDNIFKEDNIDRKIDILLLSKTK